MNKRLHYRRQFLLSREPINQLVDWQHLLLKNKSHLYCHPDLENNYLIDSTKQIVLLGNIFDFTHHNKSNKDILIDIFERSKSFNEFIQSIKKYAGRYVFIYSDDSSFNLLSDPTALREIYYCTVQNRIICGSQPNLIDEFSNPKIGTTNNNNLRRFYESERHSVKFGDYWIGDETYYNNIKHLMPNHFLNVSTLGASRYWPTKKTEKRELNVAASQACQFLKGILKSVTQRQSTMMAITSGIDSRTLLAASKDITDKIYFFINKEKPLNEKSADILIPKKIFKKFNLDFYVHEINCDVDSSFKEIFLNNTLLSSERIITTIYNIYYKKHPEKINIWGVGEIGRTRLGEAPRKLNGYYLAYKYRYRNSKYVINQCTIWLERNMDLARKYEINILTLFYWEQILGNWGAVGRSETDIALEEFNPYNSHYLFEIMLSVNKKYTEYYNNIFFREMIRNMWPDLLDFPINPPDSWKERLQSLLKKIGIYDFLWFTRYNIHYFNYLVKNR